MFAAEEELLYDSGVHAGRDAAGDSERGAGGVWEWGERRGRGEEIPAWIDEEDYVAHAGPGEPCAEAVFGWTE